jgi:hypothetical protein
MKSLRAIVSVHSPIELVIFPFDAPKDAKGFILDAGGGMTGKKIQLKVE